MISASDIALNIAGTVSHIVIMYDPSSIKQHTYIVMMYLLNSITILLWFLVSFDNILIWNLKYKIDYMYYYIPDNVILILTVFQIFSLKVHIPRTEGTVICCVFNQMLYLCAVLCNPLQTIKKYIMIYFHQISHIHYDLCLLLECKGFSIMLSVTPFRFAQYQSLYLWNIFYF